MRMITCVEIAVIEFDNRHIYLFIFFFNIEEHYRYSNYVFFTRFHYFYFWYAAVMATNEIRQCVALHCFNNLVQFLTIHKFETDWKSVAWRKSFLNICLSGIDGLHVKTGDLSAMFNLDKRTLNEYMTDLGVQEINFQRLKSRKCRLGRKEKGGGAYEHMQRLLGLTSNNQPKQTWLGIQACAWWRPAHIGGNKWPKRISMQPW